MTSPHTLCVLEFTQHKNINSSKIFSVGNREEIKRRKRKKAKLVVGFFIGCLTKTHTHKTPVLITDNIAYSNSSLLLL